MARQYTRIYNHFNTNWETGVIAKPTFYDMTEQAFRPEPSLGILTDLGIGDFGSVVSDSQEYGRGWPFTLYLNATSDGNLELMIEQTIERINGYSATNQRWYITSLPTFTRGSGIKTAIIGCTESSVIEQEAF